MPHSRKTPDATAYSMMLFLCMIWGSQQIVIKLMAPYMAPVLQIAMRSLIVGVILAVTLFAFQGGGLPRESWRPGCFVGVLFAIEFISIAEGLRLTSASHVVVYLYTAPLFTSFALHFLVKEERMRPLQWLGVVVATIGIILAFLEPNDTQSEVTFAGDLLALLAGIAWGATTVVIRRTTLNQLCAQGTMFYQMIFVGVFSLFYILMSGQSWGVQWNQESISLMIYQVAVLALIGYLGWFWMLRVYTATRIAILSLLTPLFGVFFGVLILGESLSSTFVTGAVLVIAGVGLVRIGE